jgi:hypothetical protein
VELEGWRLGGVLDGAGTDDFEFPPGARVPAGGFLVVVSMDPGLFRSRYGVPDAAPVVGPCTGALDNAGETLKLLRPYDGPGGAGSYLLVDRVRYNDREPWPVAADGGGSSLERLRAAEYGNDPVNWAASLVPGGTPGRANGSAGPGANQRPVPAFDVEMQPEPLLVLFDASPSRDPDGLISSHEWSFGDGAAGSGRTVLHRYPGAGVYTVTLELRDGQGAESRATRVVWLSEDVAGGLQSPGDGNQDGKLDLSDAVSLFGYLFLGTGRALPCEAGSLLDPGNRALLDVNADEKVDLTDGVYVLNYLFRGGPHPALGTACVRIVGCSDSCQG